MLEERDIIRHCESRMLRRARNIARTDDAIFDRRCKYDTGEKPITRLRARVKSTADWRTNYEVELAFDEDQGKVIDYACTCAASLSNPGMCKHVAAVSLVFLEAPASFAGHMSVRSTQSSAGVKRALAETSKNLHVEDALTAEASLQGLVDLEPCLVCVKEGWGLRLSVAGLEGKYVIKDIPLFLSLCRQGKFFSYGERLAFEHERDAFTPSAARLISFVERAIDIREQLSDDALNSYRGTQTELRGAMMLSTPEIVELLHVREGETLYVDDCTKLNHKPVHTRIIEGNPPLHVVCTAQANGDYLLNGDVDARIISYDDDVYVWADEFFYHCDGGFADCLPFLENVYCNKSEQAYLSSGDAPAFCKALLPVIEPFVEIDLPNELAMLRPRVCEIEIYLDRDGSTCVCEAYAVYDEERMALVEPADAVRSLSYGLRDEDREQRVRKTLNRYFPIVAASSASDAEHGLRVSDDADIARILSTGLEEFRAVGTLFTTPGFDSFVSARRPKVVFGLSIQSNLVNLTASVDDLPKSELAALLRSYQRRRRFHRLKDGSFVDLSESELSRAEEYAGELGLDAETLLVSGAHLPLYRAFQLDGLVEGASRDHAFYEYVQSIEKAAEVRTRIPSGFSGELRPYQVEGLTWLNTIAAMGLGGILADEMGLGKTIQLIAYTLAHLDQSRAYGPSLIVCPASVVYNWIAEFERFAPAVHVMAVAGNKEEREEILSSLAEGGPSDGEVPDVLVTSYDLLRRDVERYEALNLYTVTLDEAQYIKNHATISARSVKSLDALHRFALTGTPIENRLSELWSIFDFLMPGLLSTYESFRSRYEQPILDGDERALERLQALVGHFILRRMKQDVLTDLPDKDESIVYTQLGDEQMKLYRALEQRLRESINSRSRQAFSADKIAVLAEITRLRELCCDPALLYENYEGGAAKLDTIIELVESAHDSGEKTLVFSQFVQFLDIIAASLDEHGIPYFMITGSTPKRQRIQLVNEFNEDDTPVFLVSLKAGGTGLNLTGASVVVHSDPWWNLAAENQATDRAHRIGQKRAVSVYKVIAKDTIEERVVALQHAKSKLADKLVRGDGTPLASLTRDELLSLLER
ncbi:MAG: DEAD/DEAH box helicase [Coriobacteriales bacterium]